jgi:hypothetical protein
MTTVTFEVETEAEPLLVLIRDASLNEVIALKPAGGKKRTGTADVAPGKEALLYCIFAGSPGTKFKVTLSPKEKLKVTGSNPIDSTISSQPPSTARRRFEVLS